VKLVAVAKLLPTSDQRAALLATMERFNAACDWLAGAAHAAGCASQYELQRDHYRALRERFGLSSQMAVRALAKVCEVYKRDPAVRPTVRPRGAIPYDRRILSFKADDCASLLTLEGRIVVPFVAGEHHRARLHPRHPLLQLADHRPADRVAPRLAVDRPQLDGSQRLDQKLAHR